MKCCISCCIEKSLSEFYRDRIRVGGFRPFCISCEKIKSRNYYQKNKNKIRAREKEKRNKSRQWLFEYLLEHPCVDCSENDTVVLDFDHIYGNKLSDISSMSHHYGLESIKKEVKKCIVRCSNCHRKKTAKEKGYYKYINT